MTEAETNLWARVYARRYDYWAGCSDTAIAEADAAEEADAAVELLRERGKA